MSDQTTKEQISRKPTAAELFQVWFLFIIFLSAILAFWLPRLFGFQFLVSQVYYENNRIISNIFGGIVFIFCIYILWIECFFEKNKTWGNKNAPSGLKLLFIKITLPVILAACAYDVPMAAFPMLRAFLAGKTTTLEFIVKDASSYSDGKCRPEVWLENLPPTHNSICFVDEEFRKLLRPGMRIEVEGWGTADGIFLNRISIP